MYFHKLLFIACLLWPSFTKDMLIVVNFQNDFLVGGPMGKEDKVENITEEREVISHLQILIDQFQDDQIVLTRDSHPENHISFLSRHIRENQGNEKILKFLGESFNRQDIKDVNIIYDKNSLLERDYNQEKIIKMNYLEKFFDFDSETQLQKNIYLFPDHCISNTPGSEIQEDVENSLEEAETGHGDIAEYLLGTQPNVESLSLVNDVVERENEDFIEQIREDEISRVFLTGVFTEYTVLNTALDLIKVYSDLEVFIIEDATISFLKRSEVIQGIKDLDTKIKFATFEQVKEAKRNGHRARLRARTFRRLL